MLIHYHGTWHRECPYPGYLVGMDSFPLPPLKLFPSLRLSEGSQIKSRVPVDVNPCPPPPPGPSGLSIEIGRSPSLPPKLMACEPADSQRVRRQKAEDKWVRQKCRVKSRQFWCLRGISASLCFTLLDDS